MYALPRCLFTAISTILLGVISQSAAQSDEAKRFFAENPIVDGICFPYYRPGSTFHRFPRQEDGTFNMALYKEDTGVDLAVWDIRRPEEMKKMIGGVEKGHFINTTIIRSFADVESMLKLGHHGWLFHTQHPWPLNGETNAIAGWHRDGLRMLQIVYGSTLPVPESDRLGTGSSRRDDESSGLTELGRRVIETCNRLGIIIDVSHCNRQTTLDACSASTLPITSSHAGCDAITATKRNKTDAEILAIAETGGVFGITPIRFMISSQKHGATMNDFIEHLEHAIQIAGIDHVGVGSDLKRNGVPPTETVAYTCPELNGEYRWLHLYDALEKRGFGDEDLAKLFGGNFLRVFREVLR